MVSLLDVVGEQVETDHTPYGRLYIPEKKGKKNISFIFMNMHSLIFEQNFTLLRKDLKTMDQIPAAGLQEGVKSKKKRISSQRNSTSMELTLATIIGGGKAFARQG